MLNQQTVHCDTQVRTGGKGTVRRKKKAVHKTISTDDKRLQSVLKRVGVNVIPGIEEVGQHTPAVYHCTQRDFG